MIDCIVVGFGLAGACVAKRLEENGKSFRVFSDASQCASRVAGGVLNPVALKRFKMVWQAESFFPEAMSFYTDLEKEFDFSFFHQKAIHRLFTSPEEQNNWFQAADKPRLSPFLNTHLVPVHAAVQASYGFGEVNHTWMLDIKNMLSIFQQKLRDSGDFNQEKFEHAALTFSEGTICYKGLKAKKIVFCEGFGVVENPFFNHLPLQGNKGEYVYVKAENLQLDEIVKSSVFIIPQGNHIYKVGATYARDFSNQKPSLEAKNELLQKLKKTISCPFTVVDQEAGVRPTVRDRKPLVGRHPEHKNMFVCNGFGSRGILMAPRLSKQLLDFMESNIPLPKEIDCNRFPG